MRSLNQRPSGLEQTRNSLSCVRSMVLSRRSRASGRIAKGVECNDKNFGGRWFEACKGLLAWSARRGNGVTTGGVQRKVCWTRARRFSRFASVRPPAGMEVTVAERPKTNEIMTKAEAASLVRLSQRTLDRMAADGSGPERVSLSQRRVGYPRNGLVEWLEGRTMRKRKR